MVAAMADRLEEPEPWAGRWADRSQLWCSRRKSLGPRRPCWAFCGIKDRRAQKNRSG